MVAKGKFGGVRNLRGQRAFCPGSAVIVAYFEFDGLRICERIAFVELPYEVAPMCSHGPDGVFGDFFPT